MTKPSVEKRSPLKDKPLRQAGQSAQERIDYLVRHVYDDHVTMIAIAGAMFAGSLAQFFSPVSEKAMVIITGGFLVAISIYALPQIYKVRRKLDSYKLGRDGERIVAEQLEPLHKEGTFVLHDLVGGDFNLDHVVISQHGVFVIETKTRSKRRGNPKVTFDGETLLIDGMKPLDDPLKQARANARWLRDLLKVSTGKDFPVKPVVAFPGWWIESDPQARKSDIWVLEPKALPKFIPYEKVKLSDSDVNLANFHLRRFIRSG